MIDGHEGEGWVDGRIDDRDIQSVNRIDWLPVRPCGSAQRIYAELELGSTNGIDVDDVFEVKNVGQDEVFLVRCCGTNGLVERNALYIFIFRTKQIIRAILDPTRHIGVRRAAVGRVVLEPSILRWIVRGCNDDAVCEVFFTISVVNENGSRDDRSRGYTVIFLDDGLNAIRGQHFESSALGRRGERM